LIRVAIVSSSMALRIGLREILRSLPDLEVIAEAGDVKEIPAVDVLVLTSAEFLSELGDESSPVLLLSDDPDEAARLAGLPVWGVLPLDAGADELSAALHALAEGLLVGSPAMVGRLLERHPISAPGQSEAVIDPLTGREREVLQLAAEGLANKQIAAALEISEHTVKFHLSSLYAKLGVTNRTEAVRAGARRGWVVL
jgi:DNA-binding NarL/FixJ family response regulator